MLSEPANGSNRIPVKEFFCHCGRNFLADSAHASVKFHALVHRVHFAMDCLVHVECFTACVEQYATRVVVPIFAFLGNPIGLLVV